MIRYVAIGAVVGFLLSVFLLSRTEAPPIAAVPPTPPPPPSAAMFHAPEGIRGHSQLQIEDATLRHAPNLLHQLEARGVDAGP